MLKIWLKQFSVLLLVLLAVFVVFEAGPAPSTCPLCNDSSYHAPCLVNLSTGEIGELAVYEEHMIEGGVVTRPEHGQTFSLLRSAGLLGYRDTTIWTAYIDVPQAASPMQKSHFCRSCRAILFRYCSQGFVLADLYTSGAPRVYSITDGASYEIRCYSISVSYDRENKEYGITITGD